LSRKSRLLESGSRALVLAIALGMVLGGCGDSRTPPPLAFSPSELPIAAVGEVYMVMIAVEGNLTPVSNVQIASGKLPENLEVRAAVNDSGADVLVISGVPSKPGIFAFQISVRCFGTNVTGQVGKRWFIVRVVE
jgi:hypothetical protein